MQKTLLVTIALITVIFSSAYAQPNTRRNGPRFKRVMVVVMENTDYNEALSLPFFTALAKRGTLFSQFRAETHPSQPNYIAMIAGDTMGVTSDFSANIDGTHLGDLLERKGLDWRVYAENYPGNCFLGSSSGKYVRKHVPFLSFKNVQTNQARCAKIVNSNAFPRDVNTNHLPAFSMYIPNLLNDGHDTGAAFADKWLSATFGPLVSNQNFMRDTLLIVTFDESEKLTPGNQIYTVFIGANVAPGTLNSTPTNHYSMLRTIEDNFGLGTLGRNDAKTPGVLGIWK